MRRMDRRSMGRFRHGALPSANVGDPQLTVSVEGIGFARCAS
jgi:hypothetical protein